MLELTGQYGKAKVMIDNIDSATISQIYSFLNHEIFVNNIAIMPDTHAGNGAVIGFTMPMSDKIIPNIVGVDINCAMLSLNIGKSILSTMSRSDIDSIIRKYVPFGTSVHSESIDFPRWFFEDVNIAYRQFVMTFNRKFSTSYPLTPFDEKRFENICNKIKMDIGRAMKSLGTLGSGNHFIELGKSEKTRDYWFTIHTGSRQFGLKVCNYWQKKAGKGPLSYLEGDNMFGYLTDMVLAQKYADLNRFKISKYILKACGLTEHDVKERIQTHHNFIDFSDFIIRKGAIRSYKDEKMIIPFNMLDGILICEGKSNPEWNYSAPHGAGRLGSRRWAKETFSIKDAKHDMDKAGIYYSRLPLDEIKNAYKDPSIIEKAIEPTATIIDRIKPVLSMKD